MKFLLIFALSHLLILSSFGAKNQDTFPLSSSQQEYLEILYDSARSLETRDIMHSLELVYQIQKIIEGQNDVKWKSKVSNQLGRLYFYSGLLDESTLYYLQALEQAKTESTITKNRIDALIGLGSIAHKINNQENALNYFSEAISLLQSDQDFYSLSFGSLYNNLGSVHLLMGHLDKADSVIQLGIDYLEIIDPQNSNLPRLYSNLGRIHQRLKNYDYALTLAEKVKEMDSLRNDYYRLALDYFFISSIYEEKLASQQAIHFNRKSFAIADSLGFADLAYSSSNALSRLYNDGLHVDSLIFFTEISEQLLEKVQLVQANKKILEEEVKAYYNQKKQELTHDSGVFIYALKVFLLVSCIGVIYLMYYFNEIRKANQLAVVEEKILTSISEKLQKENAIIEDQLAKNEEFLLETLNYELKRNEFLQNFLRKLKQLKNQSGSKRAKSLMNFFTTSSDLKSDNKLTEFEILLENLDEQFFKRLSEKFPNFTNQEQRLCGLIRLHLSTKELALISGKSTSTLLVSKSRLRKKLGLTDPSQSLEIFLSDI